MNLIKKAIAGVMHKELSKLDALYQRHSGEACYIFGDGISLKWMDLAQFADKPSILGNMMIYHKDVNALKIPYCTLTEPLWFWPFFPYRLDGKLKLFRHSVHKEYRKSIAQNPETLFFINFSNYPVTRFSNGLYVSRFYKPPFDKDNPFAERGDSHDGTFKFQLSLAIYMGFKKAYLIGHDYTHSPSRNLHFYEKGPGVFTDHKDFSLEFIDYVKTKMDLVTVTLDGASETMDSITYKEFTGKDPLFRENVQIVDKAKLDSLADYWVGYSIY